MKTLLTSITFENFKALRKYSVSLKSMNVLVGTNNCGKSTVIGAIRLLEYAIKFGNRKKPEFLGAPYDGYVYLLPTDSMPIATENIHTDYNDEVTRITYRFSSGNTIKIEFIDSETCVMVASAEGMAIRNTTGFKRAYPFKVLQIPILGVVESEEELIRQETVQKNIGTVRASRNFRNFWYYNRINFESFAEMVKSTWIGMEITPPELDYASNRINMYCLEDRLSRELFWSGYGFQIWCQLLTYVSLSKDADILVVDEPDIYLHPELQRKFVEIVRALDTQVVLATHSTELISEAEPNEILLIDKRKLSAKRLSDIEGVQEIISNLGSVQNITLTHLAKTQRLLFIEGPSDNKIIRKIARKMGNQEIASGNMLTVIPSGGFTSWEKIGSFAWGFRTSFSEKLSIGAIFDRDYFCEEEINTIQSELKKNMAFVFHHKAKEIENYLISAPILERAIKQGIEERNQKTGEDIVFNENVSEILDGLSSEMRNEVTGQYISKRTLYYAKSGKDTSTVATESLTWIDSMWGDLETRIKILPGKAMLKAFRDYVQNKYSVNLTDSKLIDSMKKEEIPNELFEIITALELFIKS